ncbi:MAG TPA: ATP-binding protein [Syntrophorhabdaceae bacterium]
MEETVRQSELKARTILESVFAGIMVIDPETHMIVDVNPVAAKLIGMAKEDIVGHVCHEFTSLARKGECPVTDLGQVTDNAERTLVTKGGKRVPIIKTVVPVILDGRPHLLESFVDITQLKQMEERLRDAKQVADAANLAKSRFLANMSHEIRTPMNAILGFSQLIERETAVTPLQKQRLDIINRSGEHLLALINDILEMSKIEAGRVVLNPGVFDFHALLDDLERMFGLRTDGKGLNFTMQRTDEVPRFIVTDEGKLRQVLVNLLGNAVKFTEEGEIAVRISTEGPGLLSVEVEDTGHGIGEEDRARLFRPFEQTDVGIKTGGGTGLGLAISREFIRLMEGEIGVRSEKGKGALFYFRVPFSEGSEIAQIEAKPGRIEGLKSHVPAPRILVADDNDDNRLLIASLLGHVGFEIRQAVNGIQAVDEVLQWQPHLVLMDLRMPLMDGYEAIRRIRSSPRIDQPRIITLTASSLGSNAQEALIAGSDDFVSKPFRETDLLEKMGRLLEVEYIYGGEKEEEGFAGTEDADRPLAGHIPEEMIGRIKEAAIDGDFEHILELAAEVETLDLGLARKLRGLAEIFDMKSLLKMIEKR